MRLFGWIHNHGHRQFQLTHSRGVRLLRVVCADGRTNFNSRTHVECDFAKNQSGFPVKNFNSRTHVECDASPEHTPNKQRNFNSRTHVECDPVAEHPSQLTKFQLTHSRGVRRVSSNWIRHNLTFQLTHSRGVRQFFFSSIVTTLPFQLTHSRGVRPMARVYLLCLFSFQLTHSRGVRPLFYDQSHGFRPISTHALTWSATTIFCNSLEVAEFQLTHSRGVRPKIPRAVNFCFRFQLTHSRGVRLYRIGVKAQSIPHFNSRTHVECDIDGMPPATSGDISTHALTWSATCIYLFVFKNIIISTHALTWSATDICVITADRQIISTHALTWSATFLMSKEWSR